MWNVTKRPIVEKERFDLTTIKTESVERKGRKNQIYKKKTYINEAKNVSLEINAWILLPSAKKEDTKREKRMIKKSLKEKKKNLGETILFEANSFPSKKKLCQSKENITRKGKN